jgi:hypothetical protein
MKTSELKTGLHVLTEQELVAHGQHVAGGASFGSEIIGGFAENSGAGQILIYSFAATTAIGFAISLGRGFNSFTRNTCRALCTAMRNRYAIGSLGYSYFNGMLTDMGGTTNTLDTIISRAGQGNYGDPPV